MLIEHIAPDSDKVVVNAAFGSEYVTNQQRLRRLLIRSGYDGSYQFWESELPEGCPSHNEARYAFKYPVVDVARQRFPGAKVLWLDAAMFIRGSLQPIFDRMDEIGYYMHGGEDYVGRWCPDRALQIYDVTRDDMMSVLMGAAGVMGFNFSHLHGIALFDILSEWSKSGAFGTADFNDHDRPAGQRGSYVVEHLSDDPRCVGNRPTDVAVAVALYKLGLPLLPYDPMYTPDWKVGVSGGYSIVYDKNRNLKE